MSYKYGFNNCKTAERYLDKLSRKPVRKLNITEKIMLKENLKSNHDKEQLKILEVLIESELKSNENFAPRNLLFTIVVTALITFISSTIIFVIQATTTLVSANTSNHLRIALQRIGLEVGKESITIDEALSRLHKLEENVNIKTRDYLDFIADSLFNTVGLMFFLFLSIIAIILLIAVYRFDSKVEKLWIYKNMISQCLEEKSKYLN